MAVLVALSRLLECWVRLLDLLAVKGTFPIVRVFTIILSIQVLACLGSLEYYKKSPECNKPFQCGIIQNLSYPFRQRGSPEYCGKPGFELYCLGGKPMITISSVVYQVLVYSTTLQTLTVAPMLSSEYLLCGLFHYFLATSAFYKLSAEAKDALRSCGSSVILLVFGSILQILEHDPSLANLKVTLVNGFGLQWNENDSFSGTTNSSLSHFSGSKSKLHLIIELAVLVTIAIIVVCTIFFIIPRFKGEPLQNNAIHLWLRKMNNNASVEAFITKFGSLAPKRYFYADIKKMTNKFKDKLGQGGYGSVYKGKLADGRLVAVKVLSGSKGNGEDFMNEVDSIGRTSHVNIVTLLGFCYDISKRALVYEFMPHGSLDKFIYKKGSENQSRQLEWKTLHDIALGIARGLEYLHQGCTTRILHFDIKPHNILLDENFCPKISDFGLSKLCEIKESHISMTGARGTIGYIAPEVFCRNFGGVSHKSDVYSYGMMVMEMVGGRKNIRVEVSQSSEIYFPSWIYTHLEQDVNLRIDGVTTEEEEEIARKLIVVSLWCIQTNPSDRPSMTKVLEMLQGSLKSLVIPPNPFVYSPVQSLPARTSSETSSLIKA